MTERLKERYSTVCEAPEGNGFRVVRMPELILHSGIDDCEPHVHSFYEILWFREGTGRHTVDFVDYEVKPDTIFFLAPGQIHNFDHNVDKEAGICNYKGLAVQMCTDFIRDEDVNGNAMLKYNAFYTFDTAPYFTVDKEVGDELQRIVGQMEEEASHSGEFGNIDILKSLLRIFLVKVQRHGKQDVTIRLNNLKSSHQLFVSFRRLVEKEYKHLHTVQEYADRLSVSVRTLNKCVNECSQTSPLAFINDRIVLEAKRLVRYTNMMIKEIAFDLGFDDPSYFVKLFKRQTGHLPSDFRELDAVNDRFMVPRSNACALNHTGGDLSCKGDECD